MINWLSRFTFIELYKLLIINNLIFFILSLSTYLISSSIFISIIPNIFFLLSSSIILIILLGSNHNFSPIAWFGYSSFIWIGLGSISSFLKFDYFEFDSFILSNLVSMSKVNVLNSSTLLIITLISFVFSSKKEVFNFQKIKKNFLSQISEKLILLIVISLIFNLIIKIIILNIYPHNYMVISFLYKIELLEMGMTVLLGIKFIEVSLKTRFLIIIYIIGGLFYFAISMSTFIFLQFLVAFLIGTFVYRYKFWGMLFLIISLLVAYLCYNPVKMKMRTHNLIISNKLDITSKVKALSDSLMYYTYSVQERNKLDYNYNFYKDFILANAAQPGYYFLLEKGISSHKKAYIQVESIRKFIINYSNKKEDLEFLIKNLNNESFSFNSKPRKFSIPNQASDKMQISKDIKRQYADSNIFKILNRVDVVSIQRFIIKKYDDGLKGKTLENLLYLFVPRFIWHEKPVIKSNCVELHNLFYNKKLEQNKQSSCLAPSFNAEAYWNYGLSGVFFICLFYGAILSIFNNFYNNLFNKYAYFSFLLILIPTIKWIMFFEGWIIISIIGEAIIILSMYCCIRIFFKFIPKTNFK